MKLAAILFAAAVAALCVNAQPKPKPLPPPLKPICPNVISAGLSIDKSPGCKRYVTGFDITGTTNLVNLPAKDPCACIQLCLKFKGTCDNWVWKFVNPTDKVRSCTLYSNFNQPVNTKLVINGKKSMLGVIGATPLGAKNFEQDGGLVPHCQFPNGKKVKPALVGWDKNCMSGSLFTTDDPAQDLGNVATAHFIAC